MKKCILFISIDPVFYRRRVINQIESAIEAGYNVKTVTVKPELMNNNDWNITYIKTPFSKGPLRFLYFNFHVFICILRTNPAAIHARGIWVLPAIIAARLLKKYKLIYDAHEFFAGHQLFQNHLWRRLTWLPVERLAISFIDILITVSEPLGNFYKERYPELKEVKIIRSLPFKKETLAVHKQNENLQIVFHGYFLNGRGLDAILDALNIIRKEKYEFTMIGEGALAAHLRKKIESLALSAKVHIKPFIDSEELIKKINFADLGIALIEPDCINRTYALPNKFFEYIHAGVPVLASTIPTLKEYVNKYNVGFCVDPQNTQGIAEKIKEIIQNRDLIVDLRKNCIEAANELNWQNESEKQIMIYKNLLKD